MMTTYERNDGIQGNGRKSRTSCDYTWATGWLEELRQGVAARAQQERAADLALLDEAERRYFACSPAAREAAAAEIVSTEGAPSWDYEPQWALRLAEVAEQLDLTLARQ